jgi:hypothetical protein
MQKVKRLFTLEDRAVVTNKVTDPGTAKLIREVFDCLNFQKCECKTMWVLVEHLAEYCCVSEDAFLALSETINIVLRVNCEKTTKEVVEQIEWIKKYLFEDNKDRWAKKWPVVQPQVEEKTPSALRIIEEEKFIEEKLLRDPEIAPLLRGGVKVVTVVPDDHKKPKKTPSKNKKQ